MTEPVAWRYKDCGYDRLTKEKPKPEWDYKDIEPLYTLEQLPPRVKLVSRRKFNRRFRKSKTRLKRAMTRLPTSKKRLML